MLKTKLTVEEYTALSDELKAEYKLTNDGYAIDLGPDVFITDKDPANLVSALEKTREELKTVKGIADKFEGESKQKELDALKTAEEIKAHFQAELDKRDALAKEEKQAAEQALSEQRQANAQRLASEEALKLSSQLFGDKAALMLPHVERQMKGVVNSEGVPVVELVDASGQPLVDQNLDNFSKSLSTNEMFSSMVVVSNASGGSANDGGNKSSGSTNSDGTTKKISDYKSDELVALKKSDPEAFKNLLSQG